MKVLYPDVEEEDLMRELKAVKERARDPVPEKKSADKLNQQKKADMQGYLLSE